jgi:5-methylcytosine-specific restriction endonuclease McrA
MFEDVHEPLALLVAVHPKKAKQLFRQNIYSSWDHKCAYCGRDAHSLDHIIPKFKGGRTVRSNLVPACQCNHKKGSEDWIQWFQRQEFWSLEKENRIKAWMDIELTTLQWNQLKSLIAIDDDRMEDNMAA